MNQLNLFNGHLCSCAMQRLHNIYYERNRRTNNVHVHVMQKLKASGTRDSMSKDGGI